MLSIWSWVVTTITDVVLGSRTTSGPAKTGARRSSLTSSTAAPSSAASNRLLLRFPFTLLLTTSFKAQDTETPKPATLEQAIQHSFETPPENPGKLSAPPARRSRPSANTTFPKSEAATGPAAPARGGKDSFEPVPTGLGITLVNTASTPSSSTISSNMAPADDLTRTATTLSTLLRKPTSSAAEITSALTSAKRMLLTHSLLLPNPSAPPPAHAIARTILETSSLLSIRAQDPDAFTRYFSALQPFYELPATSYPKGEAAGQRSKITGLYLMLLLTKGDYAGFHTLLEGLEAEGDNPVESEAAIKYPVMLERWLMEGSYDRVWGATKGDDLPSAEFGIFSQVLMRTIQEEIASCSERAYPSIPVANAKNLLFQDSEGAVVKFAQERGWQVRDGRIYFPEQGQDVRNEKEILVSSGQVIENTIGYARELETIV